MSASTNAQIMILHLKKGACRLAYSHLDITSQNCKISV